MVSEKITLKEWHEIKRHLTKSLLNIKLDAELAEYMYDLEEKIKRLDSLMRLRWYAKQKLNHSRRVSKKFGASNIRHDVMVAEDLVKQGIEELNTDAVMLKLMADIEK